MWSCRSYSHHLVLGGAQGAKMQVVFQQQVGLVPLMLFAEGCITL
jgi:hypothetical protein